MILREQREASVLLVLAQCNATASQKCPLCRAQQLHADVVLCPALQFIVQSDAGDCSWEYSLRERWHGQRRQWMVQACACFQRIQQANRQLAIAISTARLQDVHFQSDGYQKLLDSVFPAPWL